MSDTHALNRSSPKGQPFLGTCTKCGQMDLPMSAVHEPCENLSGLTGDEAVLLAVTGELPTDQDAAQ